MDITGAFRGSDARAAGLVTRDVLLGKQYRRIFPDIYAPAGAPDSLLLRSRAAYLLVEAYNGVLSGYSAAELLGASCGHQQSPAEVTCRHGRRSRPGLVVHRDQLAPDEIQQFRGVRLTTPVRTALDLARRQNLVEAVTAVDTLAHRFPFSLGDVRAMNARHLGARGSAGIGTVLALVDRRAESPMESRLRLPLVLAGLNPVVQHELWLPADRHVPGRPRLIRLDLAFPEALLGVEFDGEHHRTAEQARRDLVRESALSAAGWIVIRFSAWTVFNRPADIVAATRNALGRRRVIVPSAH